MTDRHAAYIVVLRDDIREDSPLAEELQHTMRMLRGVASVEPVIAEYEITIARSRADSEWRERICNLLTETR
jgi:hypothetical protein